MGFPLAPEALREHRVMKRIAATGRHASASGRSSKAPTAIRTDLGAIFVSLELSLSTWLITSLSPAGGEKMSKHVVRGGDVPGLLERFAQLWEKTRARTGKVFPFVVIQEAGLDGSWIDRVLQNEAIESHVVDPASIAISRRRRRAKTDRIDGDDLLHLSTRKFRSEPRPPLSSRRCRRRKARDKLRAEGGFRNGYRRLKTAEGG